MHSPVFILQLGFEKSKNLKRHLWVAHNLGEEYVPVKRKKNKAPSEEEEPGDLDMKVESGDSVQDTNNGKEKYNGPAKTVKDNTMVLLKW